jgi:lysophospholipase L1-like esterase
MHSPLALVILMLGTNDFQSMHNNNAWTSAQGIASLVAVIRGAPIEPGMPTPLILIVVPPLPRDPRGSIAPKFSGAEARCVGLANEYQQVAGSLKCAFFDANSITSASRIDGVHLDEDQHFTLGVAIADVVKELMR